MKFFPLFIAHNFSLDNFYSQFQRISNQRKILRPHTNFNENKCRVILSLFKYFECRCSKYGTFSDMC
jgi:hypothetical protein